MVLTALSPMTTRDLATLPVLAATQTLPTLTTVATTAGVATITTATTTRISHHLLMNIWWVSQIWSGMNKCKIPDVSSLLPCMSQRQTGWSKSRVLEQNDMSRLTCLRYTIVVLSPRNGGYVWVQDRKKTFRNRPLLFVWICVQSSSYTCHTWFYDQWYWEKEIKYQLQCIVFTAAENRTAPSASV